MVLDAPVRVVADAAGLADHQVGGCQRRIQLGNAVFVAAVVMEKAPTGALDQLAVDRHAGGPAADAQDGLVIQARRDVVRATAGFAGDRLRSFRRAALQFGRQFFGMASLPFDLVL